MTLSRSDRDRLGTAFQRELNDAEGRVMQHVEEALDELKKPDRSILPHRDPTPGSVAKVRDNRELEYERTFRNADDETRKWRTLAWDLESCEYIQALANNDHAMIRGIMDRPHNRELARADLAQGTIASPGTGGGLVPLGFASQVEIIIARTAILRGFLTTHKAQVSQGLKIPTQTTASVAEVHTEGSDMNITTDPVYGSVNAETVKIGGLVKFSAELLADSPLSLISLVSADLGQAIGVFEDQEILRQTGGSVTSSLFENVTASTTLWVDATETLATLATKYYELAYAHRGRSTWIINETAAQQFTSLVDSGSRQTFAEFNTPAQPVDTTVGDQGVTGAVGSLLGRPVLVFPVGATFVPSDNAILGDLSGMSFWQQGGLRADVSRDSDFATDQIALRVSERIDTVITQGARMTLFPDA